MTQATAMLTVCVHYYAAAYAAAGTASESVVVYPGSTVADVLKQIETLHGNELKQVLPRCSYLLDGVAARETSAGVVDGARLDVLPPFAGG